MLKAAGLPVYERLQVHGYWNLGGGKMSKSLGNVVEALRLAETYGRDAFRYFVLREMPFGQDATFSEDALVDRLNADLANDLGNLVARATTMIVSFGPAAAPAPGAPPAAPPGMAGPAILAEAVERARAEVEAAMADFAFHRALAAIWELVGALNRLIDAEQPWALAKRPERRADLAGVLAALAEGLRVLGILLEPFVPDAAGRVRAALGDAEPPALQRAGWGHGPGPLDLGRVQKLSGLFPRVERGAPPGAAGGAPRAAPAPAPAVAPRITLDEFKRVDLRVAEIVAAEPVPRSKKLLKLTVRVGEETRTLVAGIAQHYGPDDLRGRKVVVVANLEPATLMGVTSHGMVLAGSADGTLALLSPDRDLPPGAVVR
jgi:methionyl-tRNA synthetase